MDYYIILSDTLDKGDALGKYRLPIFTSVNKAFKEICDYIESRSCKIEDSSIVKVEHNMFYDYKINISCRLVLDDGMEYPLHHFTYKIQRANIV